MVASGVSAVNEVSQVTTFDVSEFMSHKVSKIQPFWDVTIKIYFYWSVSTLRHITPLTKLWKYFLWQKEVIWKVQHCVHQLTKISQFF